MKPDPREGGTAHSRTLTFLLVVASLALGWILLPFYGTILWASIIAMLFTPVHRRFTMELNGRRTLAAIATLCVVLVILVLPFAFITASLAREAAGFYERIHSGELNPMTFFQEVF